MLARVMAHVQEALPLHSSVVFIQKTSAGGNGPRLAPLTPELGAERWRTSPDTAGDQGFSLGKHLWATGANCTLLPCASRFWE